MISNEQAEFLLTIPKFVVENDKKIDPLIIIQPNVWRTRYSLMGESNGDIFEFMLEIWQGVKNRLKMSLHFQEDETKIGLFRVDYWSGHSNPQTISDKVPVKFHPFVGKHFVISEHHVHYHIEGYPTLAWALPIEQDNFPYKETSNTNIPDKSRVFCSNH